MKVLPVKLCPVDQMTVSWPNHRVRFGYVIQWLTGYQDVLRPPDHLPLINAEQQ